MTNTTVHIDNLKCGGCGKSIKNGLKHIDGVSDVTIDFDNSAISIEHTEGVQREKLTATLLSLGYPETGTVSGLSAVTTNMKSFVSCAIGRMSSDTEN